MLEKYEYQEWEPDNINITYMQQVILSFEMTAAAGFGADMVAGNMARLCIAAGPAVKVAATPQ